MKKEKVLDKVCDLVEKCEGNECEFCALREFCFKWIKDAE